MSTEIIDILKAAGLETPDISILSDEFLAEVRQVRRMVESASSGQSVFVLIDEPFRGTNSAERVAATKKVPEAWSLVRFAISDPHFDARHRAGVDRL